MKSLSDAERKNWNIIVRCCKDVGQNDIKVSSNIRRKAILAVNDKLLAQDAEIAERDKRIEGLEAEIVEYSNTIQGCYNCGCQIHVGERNVCEGCNNHLRTRLERMEGALKDIKPIIDPAERLTWCSFTMGLSVEQTQMAHGFHKKILAIVNQHLEGGK